MHPIKSIFAFVALICLATSCGDNPSAPGRPGEESAYGHVRVTVSATGGDLDDLYWVAVGSERTAVFRDGSVTTTVAPGSATVALTDVASNCTVDGTASVSVNVPPADTVDVLFRVACYPTGFQITLHTAGYEVPSEGFALQMKGGASPGLPVAIGPNSSVTLTRLEPGPYAFHLESTVKHCTAAGGSDFNVVLPPMTVVQLTLDITCVEPVRLEKIAYSIDSTSDFISSYLAVSRPDGTQQTLIGEGSSPSWSPDGKKLAYTFPDCSEDYGFSRSPCANTVSVIDPETSQRSFLSFGSMPAWSPSGDPVAFVDEDQLLEVVSAMGGRSSKVSVRRGQFASDPAWSPDGQTIAFGCHTSSGFTRLCVVNKDGSNFHQLTDSASDPAYHPAWSHDGSTIAFTSVSLDRITIAVMPAAGGAVKTLTEGFDAAWSRDGTKLIFARADGLFTMNSDGTNVQRLTAGKLREPAWRP